MSTAGLINPPVRVEPDTRAGAVIAEFDARRRSGRYDRLPAHHQPFEEPCVVRHKVGDIEFDVLIANENTMHWYEDLHRLVATAVYGGEFDIVQQLDLARPGDVVLDCGAHHGVLAGMLDVEGAEAAVLAGAKRVLELTPNILLEVHPEWILASQGSTVEAVVAHVDWSRYDCFQAEPDTQGFTWVARPRFSSAGGWAAARRREGAKRGHGTRAPARGARRAHRPSRPRAARAAPRCDRAGDVRLPLSGQGSSPAAFPPSASSWTKLSRPSSWRSIRPAIWPSRSSGRPEDPDTRERLVSNALAWCEANHWDAVAGRHAQLYARLLQRHVPAPTARGESRLRPANRGRGYGCGPPAPRPTRSFAGRRSSARIARRRSCVLPPSRTGASSP